MSVSARLEIDWSKNLHITVQKPQFWQIFMFFGHQRVDTGPIFLTNYSGLALTPMIDNAWLEVDCSKTFDYIARNESVTAVADPGSEERRGVQGFR